MELTLEEFAGAAARIEKTLDDADRIAFDWENHGSSDEDKENVKFLVERAFAQTMLLLDAAKLHDTLATVRALDEEAKGDYAKTRYYEELYLVWTAKLRDYVTLFIPETPRNEAAQKATATVAQICSRFSTVARQLEERRRKRTPFVIEDEYDVQDLLESLLRIHFDDVRPEEMNPSVAGKGTRVDFFLKKHGVIVEAKMTRKGLADSAIGDELIKDVTRYQVRKDYSTLVCFVYDPKYLIKNPSGLAADVQSQPGKLRVKVLFGPDR